ncbi:HlyD family secretion protein [Rubrimonas cliftonensis]|uniref:Multidrug resistance efflux pump n=1 Tax=Rubrimonas cliftonensis TaxID=89524 RepID=A0A1H3YU35_9RHOB|nr:biotin/lipoyl-binding protein [Rubrimonas cliftonensis]SEA14524.1 Multidrug resistance efflux pump [Rubrimonas cliftonensis]
MIEALLCSLVTILPDYLFRRFGQGKRLGAEITLYTVWYELRWGIAACVILTLSLITVIFYFHPSTGSAAAFFRTVPLLPEAGGRIAAVHVRSGDRVTAGAPLFSLDDADERAAVETARRSIAEIEARMLVASARLAAADGAIVEAQGALDQALEELETKQELAARNPDVVPRREIERLQTRADGRRGAVAAAQAEKAASQVEIAALLPAQRALAEAQLAQAQVALDQTVVRAGVDGALEQLTLRVGDFVSPLMRPAGVIIPADAGRRAVLAGFDQIEAQVLKVGMAAEIACPAKPFTIIPMVVTHVQEYVASGQVRLSDQLLDAGAFRGDGTVLAELEPMFAGGLEGLPPGASCTANVYTSHHDRLQDPDLSTLGAVALHAIDATGVVHAAILRIQALLAPVRRLVLSGGH